METHIKPSKAQDVIEEKINFPVLVSPKIDGVWACVSNGKLLSRTLESFGNKHITSILSSGLLNGLRGELIIGTDKTNNDLCRNTTSAINKHCSIDKFTFCVFDLVTEQTKDLPFVERLSRAYELIKNVSDKFDSSFIEFNVIEHYEIQSIEEYFNKRKEFLDAGYEGIVIKDKNLKHKEGRSSKKQAHFWRWKPYATAEVVVTRMFNSEKNLNVATVDNLGNTKRSTHKENKIAKESLGSIEGVLVNNLTDCNGRIVKKKGESVIVSKGKFTQKECDHYWKNQDDLLGKIVEFEYFSYGLKDNPRFAVIKRIRPSFDL